MTLVTSGDAGMDPVCSRPSGVERKSNSRPWTYQVYAPFVFQMSRCSRH